MTLGCCFIIITNGILIVPSSETSYCQNHGNCTQVVRIFLTQILNVMSVVLKSYHQGGSMSEPVWNSIRDMRANKLQALLIFRSQGSFSQLLVHKKCARLTTVKTCSVGPWLSTVMLPGFQRILLGTTLRKDAGNMTSMVGKEKKLASIIY